MLFYESLFMLRIRTIMIVTYIISVYIVLEDRQNYHLLLNIWKVSDYKWLSDRDIAGEWVAGLVVTASPIELELFPCSTLPL